ncbi:AMP-binding enzyme [Paenibacillus qinlingensis]|uniref:AMP-binding enzyme n=1 Tax=Paenibacillus qinlingensis TaxID=1837343 RepID=UPI00156598A7|nr:AMP-binding protein [Paenibacillus qinlingensis]NQX61425.1 AMP-binding protein [Paenibacillus qinlingensis]
MNKKLFAYNQTYFGRDDLEARWKAWGLLPHTREAWKSGKRIGLCIANAAELIPLVLYLKELGVSALLLHGETPLETAKTLSQEAGCIGLVYQSVEDGYLPIPQSEADIVPVQEPSICMFSSGTTGKPKLISRSWSAIEVEITAYNAAIELDSSITPIVISPVSHSYGLISGVLSAMERQVVPHVAAYTNPKLTLALLRDTPKHIVYGVPMTLHVLTSFPSDIRFYQFMSSGAPMPQGLIDRLTPMAFGGLLQQYGCSEAGCISMNRSLRHSADIGKLLGHIQLVETGSSPDVPKELVIAIQNQVIYTGDLAYQDQEVLHLLSRADDVINVSGLKVYPLEVENVISQLPGIGECVVYRGSHPVMGEIVCCMVVADPEIKSETIREWCIQKLPPYKVPSKVVCVTKLPRNATGKISRKLLEEAELS